MTQLHGSQVDVPGAREVAYEIKGDFLEVCDCFTVCPCWIGRSPDEGRCTGVFAWVINKGKIDGTDVSGHSVVSVSTHEGHRENSHQRVMLFVDDDASDRQMEVLAGVFSGMSGGPLAELSRLLGELLLVQRTSIDISFSGRLATLNVGRLIVAEGATLVGPTGEVTTLSHARLSNVLGETAEVGVTRRFKVGLPAYGMDCDLKGRSAMRGSFHYAHKPASK